MFKFLMTTFTFLLATTSLAQRTTPTTITNDSKLKVPKKTADAGKLHAALGPLIVQFEKIPGCPYPDPERDILRYRVNAAPDGARVREIRISYLRDTGPGGAIFHTYFPPTAGLRTAGTAKDGRRTRDYLATTGFILQATDTKGRTSSRRLAFRYWDPTPRLDYLGVANRPTETHTPSGIYYDYAFRIAVDNMSIGSIDAPDHVNLYKNGRLTTAPVSGVILIEGYNPHGGWHRLRLPSRRFETLTSLVLHYRTQVYDYTVYRDRAYDRWAAEIRLGIRHPRGCSSQPGFAQVEIPGRSAPPPPAPEPRPLTEPYFNAYRSEVECNCTDGYTNARLTVEGCMLDSRSASRVCSAAAATLPSKRTTCTWAIGAYRRISDEKDCNDVNPAPVITKIDTGKE